MKKIAVELMKIAADLIAMQPEYFLPFLRRKGHPRFVNEDKEGVDRDVPRGMELDSERYGTAYFGTLRFDVSCSAMEFLSAIATEQFGEDRDGLKKYLNQYRRTATKYDWARIKQDIIERAKDMLNNDDSDIIWDDIIGKEYGVHHALEKNLTLNWLKADINEHKATFSLGFDFEIVQEDEPDYWYDEDR